MQVTTTTEFINSIPAAIRLRLKLRPGMVLDFDEQAPYLKAVPASPVDDDAAEFDSWLKSSIGLAKGKFTTDQRMSETRGED